MACVAWGVERRHPRAGRIALGALFGGAAGIAFAPIFVRLSEVGPSATAFWRLALALPALWAWAGVERPGRPGTTRPSAGRDLRRVVAAGLFFASDLAVWHWSIRLTSVANATLLANVTPIFVTLGAWLWFGQRVTATFILAIVTALAGAAVLVGISLQLSAQHLFGDLLGVVTAIFYAGYLLAVTELRGRFSSATVLAWSSAFSAAALLPITMLSREGLMPSTGTGWGVLIGLALVSQVAGQGLITYALAHLPAAFSSVGLLLQPVIAALLAWIILNEPIGAWQALGGAIVLVGIALARRASR